MYKIIVESNNTLPTERESTSRNVLKAAEAFGRCESGETVSVYRRGKLISQARYTPEQGGRYYRVTI